MSDEDQGPHADTVRHIPISITPTRVLDLLDGTATVATEQVAINTNLPLRIRISLPVQSGTTILIYDHPSDGFLGQPSAISPNVTIEGSSWPFTLRYLGPVPGTGSDIIVIQVPVSAEAPVGQNVRLITSKDGVMANAAITFVLTNQGLAVQLGGLNPPVQVGAGSALQQEQDHDGGIDITIINIDLDSD